MGKSTTFLPVILLGSGVALTAAGLVVTFAKGPATPALFFGLMIVGIIDGLMGLIWTSATILWGNQPPQGRPGPAGAAVEAERERDRMRTILLTTGVLCIVFLGLLAAIAFRIPLILQWIRLRGIL